jgi:hypothetical protein
MVIINAMPISTPGMIPPRKSPPIETCAMAPYTTIVMLGGMIAPIVPAVAIRAAAKPGLYPDCFIVGMSIDAIAEASAVDEPETPDITMLPTTEACASPARR